MWCLLLKRLSILLWKCWIMRRRHIISTIFELLCPLLLSFLIAYNSADSKRSDSNKYNYTEQIVGPVIYDNPTMNMVLDNDRVYDFVADIYYAPINHFTDDLMAKVKSFRPNTIKIFKLENGFSVRSKINSLVNNRSNMVYNYKEPFGAVFDEKYQTKEFNDHFEYSILITGPMSQYVNKFYETKNSAGPVTNGATDYPQMFCKLQTFINEVYYTKLAQHYNKTRIETSSVKAYKFPYPKYKKVDANMLGITEVDFIAATIIIGYVVLCPLIVKRIADEKAIKVKELLKMMGMSDWVFWGSHFINYFSVMLFHAIIFTILFCVGLGGDPIVYYFSPFLLFAIIALFSAQLILFCMLITTVFNKPVMAVVVTVIIYILSYCLPIGFLHPLFRRNIDVIAANPYRLISCLLPNMAISWSFAIVGQFELFSVEAGFTDLSTETKFYGSLTLETVISVMFLSCILFCFLIWYMDNIWPFQFGVPKPVYFPCLPSYYCPKQIPQKDEESVNDGKNTKNENFETEPHSKISIRTKNLRKSFQGFGGEKVAVNNVSLNIYFGQITVLLGHNGAGKTTTMNMITGIFPPTSGTVFVNGFNVVTNTTSARRSIGLCPQENIIYNELTVEQHLKLYAVLKDFPYSLINKEIDKILGLLRLTEKKKSMAISLSGGMKRKLALGISMIGGTEILILDEPTSGLDPEARRAVWDVLQNMRKEKTILLTTHYMEEADVLGDRIAIMSEGRIKCCGSAMFLKKRFGAGYHLTISKANNYNKQLVENTLHKYLPEAKLQSEINIEVIFSLESQDSSKSRNTTIFPNLFDELENKKQELGIDSYGITITTMEDVFLKVGSSIEVEEKGMKGMTQKSLENLSEKSNHKLKGINLFSQRVFGLLMKRFHFSRRYWPMILFQIVVPSLLFISILYLDYKMRHSIKSLNKNLTLDLKDLYGNTFGFFHASDDDFKEFGLKNYLPNAQKQGMSTSLLTKNQNPNDWALSHANNLNEYTTKYLMGANLQKTNDNKTDISLWYNNEVTHSLPLSINLIYESLISYSMPELKDKIKITVHNKPIGMNEEVLEFIVIYFSWFLSCLLLIPIAVPFLGASYILFPIQERVTKAKLLQLMTGLSSITFWFCNFIFDLFIHTIAVVIIFIAFAFFDFNEIFFGQTNTAIGLFLMLFLFGFTSIPTAYCFSLIFSKPSTGFTLLVVIYLFFGLIANLIMSVLDIIINQLETEVFISPSLFNIILALCHLVPAFSMNFGIQKLYLIGSFSKLCRQFPKNALKAICPGIDKKYPLYGCCTDRCGDHCYEKQNPLKFGTLGIGQEFLYMIIFGLIFFMILWVIEGNLKKLLYKFESVHKMIDPNEDSDVLLERQRIENLKKNNKLNEEAIAVIDLTKSFSRFIAVNDITFGVHKEECFGLLGVNGAGKTTTFSMLTGDLMLDEGNAFINSYELRKDLFSYQKQIGYCPQFDALLEKLTGEEMLYLFARLRGVPSAVIELKVKSLIQMVDLQNHSKKCTEDYSGGNKRKLSIALAVIGNPPVIFLDEPTAGVDPAARRKIWTTLDHIKKIYHSAIILTSHSMEESEALCGRIAIMVSGKFKCLGSTQHLRSKFGQGFTVIIKLKRELNDNSEYVLRLKQHIATEFPSAVLRDSHQCLLYYGITDTSVKWSYIFRVMESTKIEYNLEDYTVSDTSLEQIFLAFAKTQN